jgi:tRNA threonylcarbamoyladenosine biosynthesis protein TsaE
MMIATQADMLAYGSALSATLRPGDWLAIEGPLGAGKTVLSKGILLGLGFEGEVPSPSYAIINRYDPPEVSVPVAHIDLYRLQHIEELDELGVADGRADCITIVEWANRFPAAQWNPTHHISILPNEDGTRVMKVSTAHDS